MTNKWMSTLALGLALPGSIWSSILLSEFLAGNGIISKQYSGLFALIIPCSLLVILVIYAIQKSTFK